MATEQQAEVAIKKLKAMIEAAENSNQAGEDAVVAAAAGLDTLAALEEAKSEMRDWGPDHPAIRQIDAALAKARGES